MSLLDYALLEQHQNGACAICGKKPDRLVVDHCHSTGKMRGLLCHQCNTVLGLVHESPLALKNAIEYLETAA
jgi:formate dehydrogenase maturation protein FdhE